MKHNLCLLPGA